MTRIQKQTLANFTEVELLARTIYGEARGEPIQGQAAVASVIINRTKNPKRYGKGIRGVILKKFQFSCWNADDPNLPKLLNLNLKCDFQMKLAEEVIDDKVGDPTKGATHYHTRAIKPYWIKDPKQMVRTVAIGHHIFYREV